MIRQARRAGEPDVIAGVSALHGDVELHNRVSAEHYSTLEKAARVIEQYGECEERS